jgi:hypothetical protein
MGAITAGGLAPMSVPALSYIKDIFLLEKRSIQEELKLTYLCYEYQTL